MAKITYRRVMSLGDYESIGFEIDGSHDDPNKARLIAAKNWLELAKNEMIRIYGIKQQQGHPWNRIEAELQGVITELGE